MGVDPNSTAAEARIARQRYVEAARRASQAGPGAPRHLCAAHSAFVRTMLRLRHPALALDAAHALLAAQPGCPRTQALVERLRSEADARIDRGEEGEFPASRSVRNVSI